MTKASVYLTERQRVRERIAQHRCLFEGCNNVMHARGLCETHYQQFYRMKKAAKGAKVKADWIAGLIRRGKLLALGQQRKNAGSDYWGA